MQFREASPRKAKAPLPPKTKIRKSGQSSINSFDHGTSNPVLRQRSLQQISAEEQEFMDSPWGDTDEDCVPHDEDPIELSDEEVPLAVRVKQRRTLEPGVQSATKASEAISMDRAVEISPVQECFKALQALQTSVRVGSLTRRWLSRMIRSSRRARRLPCSQMKRFK